MKCVKIDKEDEKIRKRAKENGGVWDKDKKEWCFESEKDYKKFKIDLEGLILEIFIVEKE